MSTHTPGPWRTEATVHDDHENSFETQTPTGLRKLAAGDRVQNQAEPVRYGEVVDTEPAGHVGAYVLVRWDDGTECPYSVESGFPGFSLECPADLQAVMA